MSVDVDGAPLGDIEITVRRPQATGSDDPYGVPIPAAPLEFTIDGCSLQPMVARNVTTEEITATTDLVTTRWRLFAPYGSDLTTTDLVVYGDLVLEVDGDPTDWYPDEYGDGHREVYLKRWEG